MDIHIKDGVPDYEVLIPEYMPLIKTVAASFPERYREDLIQEGLIGLINAASSFSPEDGLPFKPYANACIRNSIYTACRKLRFDSRNESLEDDSIPADSCIEEDIIEKKASSDFFDKLRDELSPLESKILTEYLRDRSYAQISALLNVSYKTIDNSLTRIKAKIKKLYN